MKQNNSTELLGNSFDEIYNKNGPPDPPDPKYRFFPDFPGFSTGVQPFFGLEIMMVRARPVGNIRMVHAVLLQTGEIQVCRRIQEIRDLGSGGGHFDYKF